MSDDQLALRKACLLQKLLGSNGQKITRKAVDTLFASAKVTAHLPIDPHAVQRAIDELLGDGAISVAGGKSVTYIATPQAREKLGQLPEFPPPPAIDVKMKSFVMMSLLALGDVTPTVKAVTPPPALGLPKGTMPRVVAALAQDGLIEPAPAGGTTKDEPLNYRLTESGRRQLPRMPQHPKANFKLSGDTLNTLLRYAASGAPPLQPTALAPDRQVAALASGLTDDSLIDEARRLMPSKSHNGLLPIFELRRAVQQKFGERAASHEQFDPQLKRLRGKRLDLVSISDRSRAQPDQLRDGVQGIEELFFYIEDLR